MTSSQVGVIDAVYHVYQEIEATINSSELVTLWLIYLNKYTVFSWPSMYFDVHNLYFNKDIYRIDTFSINKGVLVSQNIIK